MMNIEANVPKKTGNKIGKRLNLLLATCGFLSVALACSVTMTEQGAFEAGSPAAANASGPDATVPVAPATGTKVYTQGMGLYHWHKDCPLADDTSRRTGTKTAAKHRKFMSVEQAHKHGLRPCMYCFDLKK